MPLPPKDVRRPRRLTTIVTSFFLASLAVLGVLDRLTPTSAAQDGPAASVPTVTGGQVNQSQSVVRRLPSVEAAVQNDVSPPLYLIPPAPRQPAHPLPPVKPIPPPINPTNSTAPD